MKKQFINGIRLDRTGIDPQTFPYNLNCLQQFNELTLDHAVTFFCGENGSQFLIATHSPILLGYAYGVIHDMDRSMAVVAYEDTAAYQTYRAFLNHPRGMQKHLFEEV